LAERRRRSRAAGTAPTDPGRPAGDGADDMADGADLDEFGEAGGDLDDTPATAETHRGGFGEFGGTSGGLIERTFRERIILVGLVQPPATVEQVEESLDELARLVDTAGADVVDRVVQRRQHPDPATYIGKGKAHELRELSEIHDVDTVVFDDDLTPSQQVNLEKILGRTAIDRTAVILDIFAQNASTPEGKAQVRSSAAASAAGSAAVRPSSRSIAGASRTASAGSRRS